MKSPKARNAAISLKRVRGWANYFAHYRHTISEGGIRDWLKQFADADNDLAARVLDCVEIYSYDQIAGAFRTVLASLPGWDVDPAKRLGKWRFVPYSASAGESGDTMLHQFRVANNLAGKNHKELFIGPSDLLRQGLGSEDTVVLVDDFVGTGSQVCDSWNEQFGELLAEVGNVYLVVVSACLAGVTKVQDETDLRVIAPHTLNNADNLFAAECTHFDATEKATLLTYCSKASKKEPKGKGECGLVVVFSHGCPNNSIPILHVDTTRWQGLFKRYN
jgi:hypothetical protein